MELHNKRNHEDSSSSPPDTGHNIPSSAGSKSLWDIFLLPFRRCRTCGHRTRRKCFKSIPRLGTKFVKKLCVSVPISTFNRQSSFTHPFGDDGMATHGANNGINSLYSTVTFVQVDVSAPAVLPSLYPPPTHPLSSLVPHPFPAPLPLPPNPSFTPVPPS
jgi:hypothetical protein